jgi:hypothetical protein
MEKQLARLNNLRHSSGSVSPSISALEKISSRPRMLEHLISDSALTSKLKGHIEVTSHDSSSSDLDDSEDRSSSPDESSDEVGSFSSAQQSWSEGLTTSDDESDDDIVSEADNHGSDNDIELESAASLINVDDDSQSTLSSFTLDNTDDSRSDGQSLGDPDELDTEEDYRSVSSSASQPDGSLYTTKTCQKTQTLPFAFTWSESHLYMTVSHGSLKVFRVPLVPETEQAPVFDSIGPMAQKCDPIPKLAVEVPSKMILLPSSSHNRPVQFFPPTGQREDAILVIGPRRGHNPASLLCMHLRERDLGIWMGVDSLQTEETRTEAWPKFLENPIGEPWVDSDCILQPFHDY